MAMAEPGREVSPQAVLGPLTRAALFLVVTIDAGGEPRVRDTLAELSGLQRAVGFRAQAATLSCVTGIGSEAWDRLFAGPRPAELHSFRELTGPVHRAVATPPTCCSMFGRSGRTCASRSRRRSWTGCAAR